MHLNCKIKHFLILKFQSGVFGPQSKTQNIYLTLLSQKKFKCKILFLVSRSLGGELEDDWNEDDPRDSRQIAFPSESIR